MGVIVGGAKVFLGQPICIVETNTFQLTFFSSVKVVGATGFRSLWALEWAWQTSFWINRWVLTRLIHFSLNFLSSIKIVGTTYLGGLWALKCTAYKATESKSEIPILYL